MNITIIRFSLSYLDFYILKPIPIKKETEKCYWSKEDGGARFLKSEIGKVRQLSSTTYPYLELVMIDATEKELKKKMADWFEQKAKKIIETN